jgi:hypothetical protein
MHRADEIKKTPNFTTSIFLLPLIIQDFHSSLIAVSECILSSLYLPTENVFELHGMYILCYANLVGYMTKYSQYYS